MSHKDALIQHAQEREMAMLYGEAVEETDATDGQRWATGGIASSLSTHVHDGSSTNFTIANWRTWMSAMRGDGPEERLAFVGKTAYKAIYDMVANEGTQQLQPGENKWGFRMKRLITPGPDLLLHEHPLLDVVAPGDIIVLDVSQLTFRFMSGDDGTYDFKHEAVELTDNQQVAKWQFYSFCGMQLGYEESHGYIKGITTFTAA